MSRRLKHSFESHDFYIYLYLCLYIRVIGVYVIFFLSGFFWLRYDSDRASFESTMPQIYCTLTLTLKLESDLKGKFPFSQMSACICNGKDVSGKSTLVYINTCTIIRDFSYMR